VIYFHSSCSWIAYLGFHILLSEITCLDLVPEFIPLLRIVLGHIFIILARIVLELSFYRSIYFFAALGQTSLWVFRLVYQAELVRP
jgi:hypothetical protein